MTPINDLAAAILAGGKSRRFGRPKARAVLGDTELIDRSLSLALTLSTDSIIVHSKAEAFDDKGIETVVDVVPDLGPVGGILTALAHIEKPWLATIPCDMPLLDRFVYDQLYQKKIAGRPIAAVSARGVEPLVALWPRASLNRIEEYIAGGGLSLRGLLSELDGDMLDIRDAAGDRDTEFFFNINTQSDLTRLKTNGSL